MSSSVCHKVTIMALLLSGSISQSPPSNPCWVRAAGSTESRETETTSSILPGRTSTVDTLACMAHLLAPAFPGGGRLRSDYITGGRANRKTLLPERSGQVGVKGRGCALSGPAFPLPALPAGPVCSDPTPKARLTQDLIQAAGGRITPESREFPRTPALGIPVNRDNSPWRSLAHSPSCKKELWTATPIRGMLYLLLSTRRGKRENGGERHARPSDHAGGPPGQARRRHAPRPGAGPAADPAARRVQGVRRLRRSAERQDA